jgi:hypothetical protein
VSASVTQVKLPAVEAAQETAGTIIERLESDLDPLAEPLERAARASRPGSSGSNDPFGSA